MLAGLLILYDRLSNASERIIKSVFFICLNLFYNLKVAPDTYRDLKMGLGNLNRVMEAETISKNGASPKSQMSKENLKDRRI